MQRNTHSTAFTDPPFSATEPGFTDGNAEGGDPPSTLESRLTNNLMEELARACEGSGNPIQSVTDPTDNYDQLDDTIQELAQLLGPNSSEMRYVIDGLRFTTSGVSLDVTTLPGFIVFDGRRYAITQDKLDATGYDSFTLTASMDTYFYIAPEDPGDIQDNRRTVHIETVETALGAGVPATPSGTFLFQKVSTDGSGVTSTQDYNCGIPMLSENGGGILWRRRQGAGSGLVAIPMGNSMELGTESDDQNLSDSPEVGAFFDKVCSQNNYLKSSHSTNNPLALAHEYTRHATTAGSSDTTDIALYDSDDWTGGTVIFVEAYVTAFDENDEEDSYAAIARFMVIKHAGSWDLDGSGVDDPEWEDGDQAIAAGVTIAPALVGSEINLRVTGHSGASDQMRWFCKFRVLISSHETDLP